MEENSKHLVFVGIFTQFVLRVKNTRQWEYSSFTKQFTLHSFVYERLKNLSKYKLASIRQEEKKQKDFVYENNKRNPPASKKCPGGDFEVTSKR